MEQELERYKNDGGMMVRSFLLFYFAESEFVNILSETWDALRSH